jgi:NodT family efflux transporter outer membrane factor (OMF) lipoprotein
METAKTRGTIQHGRQRRHRQPVGTRGMAILVGLAAFLGGCTAGPDFRPPEPPDVDSYVIPVNSGLQMGAAIRKDWYHVLGSPAVDALIQQAIRNGPTLAEAQARVTEARAQLRAQGASLLPSLSVSAGESRNKANGSQFGQGSPLFRSTFDLYSVDLTAGYSLDLAGANHRAVESAAARLDSARAQYQAAYITLEANVVSSSIEAAALGDEILATQAVLDMDSHRLAIYEAQEELGRIAGAGLFELRSQIAATRAMLPPLKQQLAATQSTLAALVGVPIGEFRPPPLTLKNFHLPSTLPVSVASELVRQRPDILAAEANLHDATAHLGVATANLYPSVTLSASYGTLSNIASEVFTAQSMIWSLGASIAQPIFDGGHLRAERDAAKASLEASAAEYRDTVLNAFREVSNTLQALQNDAETVRDQDEALAYARDATTRVDAQMLFGSVGHLDVLTSMTQLEQSHIAEIEARGQQFLDVVVLYRSLGGGWWSTDATDDSGASGLDVVSAR